MNCFKLYLKNNKLKTTVIICLSLLISLVSYLLSERVRHLFEFLNSENEFFNNIIVIVIYYILVFGMNLLYFMVKSVSCNQGKINLSFYCKEKFLRSDYEYIIQNDVLKVESEYNLISSNVNEFISSLIVLISTVIQLIIYTIILSKISIWCIISIALFIPITYFLISLTKNKLQKYQMEFINHTSLANSTGLEILYRAKNIECKSVEKYFVDKYQALNDKTAKSIVKFIVYNSYSTNILSLITSVCSIVTIYIISLITDFNLSKEDLLVLYLFVPMLLGCLNDVFTKILLLYKVKPYLKKFSEIEKLKGEQSGDIHIKDIQTIKTDNLEVQLNNKIIRIPDMTINKGDKILIKGASGIGKSTFFNVLLGLIHNYNGSLKINDIELVDLDINCIRNLVGISFQNDNIYSMSIRDNIKLGNDMDIEDLIDKMELRTLVEQKKDEIINAGRISGGEKSRIVLAQNIAQNPRVILIDESTTNINEEMEEIILKNLINNFNDYTIICISHRKSSEKYFDKIIEYTGGMKSENI